MFAQNDCAALSVRYRSVCCVCLLTCVCMLQLGAWAFSVLEEEWSFGESLYFCVVSLTTVGLGDYVPASRGGCIFNYLYCTVGLGLMAVALTAIGNSIDSLNQRLKAEMALVADVPRAMLTHGAASPRGDSHRMP